jgi:hypothetical protein
MRSTLVAVLAAAGIGLAGTSASLAAPANGIVIDKAADALQLTEPVHCRGYLHAHPGWHGWGTGCYRAPAVFIGPRFHHHRRHHGHHRGHHRGHRR